MAEVAIIIPTMRAHNLPNVVQSIVDSTNPGDYRIIVVATGECAEVARTLPVVTIDDGGGTWAQRINRAYKESVTEPIVVTAADDLRFHPNWLPPLRRTLEAIDGGGVCAVNDQYNAAGVHFGISKSYLDTLGGVVDEPPGTVCCEAYAHSFVDDELRATAIARGRWAGVIHDSVVEHLHHGAGKSPHDAVYQMGADSMGPGLNTFRSRCHLWGA